MRVVQTFVKFLWQHAQYTSKEKKGLKMILKWSALIPVRFLTLISHLIVTITILWSRTNEVALCLPPDYVDSDFQFRDTQLVTTLSITIAFLCVELLGLMSGVSMFMTFPALISIVCHTSGCASLGYLTLVRWNCTLYWWVFGFSSTFPAVIEFAILVVVLGLKTSF